MERRLVTLRTVSKLIPLENCDNIVLAVIDGWQVIVKKDEFKVGSDCLFFEIDSFLPASDSRFDFLAKNKQTYLKREGYRIKTMKLRGALSQGLALPLSLFPEIIDRSLPDYSELLGVIKYDNSQAGNHSLQAGNTEGKFPSFIPKTDQERVQNLMSYFDTMKDEEFEETLKLDGSSMTCYKKAKPLTLWDKIKKFFGANVKDYHFGVCSRNLEIKRPSGKNDRKSNFWEAAEFYDIENKLPVGYAIQGELIAPNIQANHEKVVKPEYYVFDCYDIVTGGYVSPGDRHKFCELMNVPHVPVIGIAKPFNMTLDELLKHVEGESMNPGTISEGRVYKHISKNISFKVISNQYLLKSEK